MRQFNAWGLGLVALAGFGACSDGGNTTPESKTNIALAVAPLSLPGIANACYDVRVVNQVGDLVWEQGDPTTADSNGGGEDGTVAASEAGGSLCASRYGNSEGGDIAYVGPCDASSGNQLHNVTVWVHGLFSDATTTLNDDDWDNPCSAGGNAGCTLQFTCIENQDVEVEFNFVIMRDADQGFFDVAVNFADIFCSGKLDTCTGTTADDGATETPITLLFGTDGTRQKTAVFAMACTGGTSNATIPPGDINTDTVLFANNLNITCGSGTTLLDPGLAEGNHAGDERVASWAIYRGTEELDCGTGPGSCQKVYWNVAIDMNETQADCNLTTSFSASGTDSAFDIGASYATPANSSYPVVQLASQLTSAGNWATVPAGNDGLCINVPLGTAGPAKLMPEYTDFGTPATFCYKFAYSQENEASNDFETDRSGDCGGAR